MRARIINLLHANGYTDTEEYIIADDIGRKPHVYLPGTELIIADIQLPGISGIDLANKLKKDPDFSDIPILFVSGYGDAKTIAAAVRAGAADYIVKPFENEVFLEKMKKILEGQHDIPDEFKFNEEKFVNTVSLEYQRAARGGQYLSFLMLGLDMAALVKNLEAIRNALRRIDTLCIFKNKLILILPMTNEAGVAVVTAKLRDLLSGNSAEIQESGSYTYYGDSELSSNDFINAVLKLVNTLKEN